FVVPVSLRRSVPPLFAVPAVPPNVRLRKLTEAVPTAFMSTVEVEAAKFISRSPNAVPLTAWMFEENAPDSYEIDPEPEDWKAPWTITFAICVVVKLSRKPPSANVVPAPTYSEPFARLAPEPAVSDLFALSVFVPLPAVRIIAAAGWF